jgi:hypothetical protein
MGRLTTFAKREVGSGTAFRGGPTVIYIVDHSDQALVCMSGTLALFMCMHWKWARQAAASHLRWGFQL